MSHDDTPSIGELLGMTEENDLRDQVARLERERNAALVALWKIVSWEPEGPVLEHAKRTIRAIENGEV